MRHAFLVGAVLGVVGCSAQPAAAAPTSTPVTGLSAAGNGIALAADGSMWLTEPAGPGRLARIAPDGAVTEFTGGVTPNFNANRSPDAIAITSDNYVWFLLHGWSEEIDRLSIATGDVTQYTLNTGTPTSIAAGADGKLWMTATGDFGSTDFIARYSLADATTQAYSTGFTANSEPRSITANADGSLSFVEGGSPGRLGHIAADGTITYRDIGGAATTLAGGPNATLWFARGANIGLIGNASPTLFATSATPTALAAGPDDAMWGATTGGIIRIASNGTSTTYAAGIDPAAQGIGLAAGADGHMWMTLDRAPYLVRITVPPRVGAAAASTPAGCSMPSPTSATVTADVRPNGILTSAAVQLRSSDGTWATLNTTSVGDGLSSLPVSFDVAGLTAGATNTLRVVATNAAGTATSAQADVAIPAPPPPATTPQPTTPLPTAPLPTTPPVPSTTPLPTLPLPTTPRPTTPQPTIPVATTPARTTPEPTTPKPVTLAPTTPPVAAATGSTGIGPATPGAVASPAPVQGLSVVLRPMRGTVTYRVPGSSDVHTVVGASSIPNSSIVDTTGGAVSLSSNVNGTAQLGSFYGGEFKVKQVKATGMTQLYLTGALDCTATRKGLASRYAAVKNRRHVWGQDDHGKFQTHGQDSVATVRGTQWLTTDTCAGTVVKVFKGAVSVAPRYGSGKAVVVKAGGRHFTPHQR